MKNNNFLFIDVTQLKEISDNKIETKYIQRDFYREAIVFDYREDVDYVYDKILTIYINKKTVEIALVLLEERRIPKSAYGVASLKSWILYRGD